MQVYTPYIVVNKTGLPFAVRASKARVGSPVDVAGETRSGEFNFHDLRCYVVSINSLEIYSRSRCRSVSPFTNTALLVFIPLE